MNIFKILKWGLNHKSASIAIPAIFVTTFIVMLWCMLCLYLSLNFVPFPIGIAILISPLLFHLVRQYNIENSKDSSE